MANVKMNNRSFYFTNIFFFFAFFFSSGNIFDEIKHVYRILLNFWHHQHLELVYMARCTWTCLHRFWTISLFTSINSAHRLLMWIIANVLLFLFTFFFSFSHPIFFLLICNVFTPNILTEQITFIIYHRIKLIIVVFSAEQITHLECLFFALAK